jgi:hypothetical protein
MTARETTIGKIETTENEASTPPDPAQGINNHPPVRR